MNPAKNGGRPRVVVIGAGLAGCAVALSALDAGAEVLMLDRGGLGLGTNSALANGVFAGPTSAYPAGKYLDDTVAVGKDLNRRDLLEVAAQGAAEAFAFLRPHGLELSEGPASYSFRSPRPDVFRGAEMMRALAASLRGRPGFTFRGGFQAKRLVVEGGRLAGIEGWHRDGRLALLPTATAILATGGAAAIYARNDNQKSSLGQGWLLAARAGLDLLDMEFVQFYPLVIDQPGLPQVMLYPPYPKQARLVDAKGEDIAAAHGLTDLDQAIVLLRDAFAALVYRAAQAGPVYMDYTGVPESAWADYPMALFTHLRHDFRRQPVRVTPGAHFCMGGVRIDQNTQTGLPGLLACGEAAWGLHGANRRGGNALTECVVFGRIAGRTAAAMAAEAGPAGPEREIAPAPAVDPGPGPEPRRLLAGIREIAWQRAGVERDAAGLAAGLIELAALRAQVETLPAEGPAQARKRDDLTAAELCLRSVLTASQGRRESRGSFARADYPEIGAERVHSRLRPAPGGDLGVEYFPA